MSSSDPPTPLDVELNQQVSRKVQQCYQRAYEVLGRRFPIPTIKFNQRGKVAGSARLQTNEIRLNQTLLLDNIHVFMDEVIPHEICHLLAYQLYGKVKPHGLQWQTLMLELFRLSPPTRHTMDTDKVAGKQFDYYCKCGPISLSIRRHNKVLRKQQQYICRKCGELLTYNEVNG